MPVEALPSPELTWGLLSRGIGLVYLISFSSLWSQVLPTAGRDGVMPVANLLQRIRRDFPGPARHAYFPTLLWLGASDARLRLLVALGWLAAGATVFGGPLSPLTLGLCYLVYLSLDRAMGLVFPWDCVLMEAGFLGIFIGPTLPLPALAAIAAPLPAVAWVYRLLVLRVLLGFGKFKFIGATRDDWAYLTGFLVAQPLASPIGWYLHKAPLWFLKAAMVGLFVAEIPVPLMLLHPGWGGIAAGAIIALLMVGIWLSGNFGFFNIAIIVLCVVTLDTETPRALTMAGLLDPAHALTHGLLALHLLGAVAAFPLNSFCGQAWLHWPVWLRLPPPLRAVATLLRALHPFRIFHPFGVFPPKILPGVKCVPIVEGSWDGSQSYRELHHRFSPTVPESRPRFIAPHHPRGDQAVVYETFGLNDTSMFHNLVGGGTPYTFTKLSGAHALLQRLMEGKGPGYGTVFFARDALPGSEPPRAMRITTHMLLPTSHAERVATGRWWSRSYIGPHLPAQQLRPHFWDDILPPPELWHWEDVIWKRRSSLGRLTGRARAGQDPDEAILADVEDLSATDVARFWEQLVPAVAAADRDDWDGSIPALVDDLRGRFDDRQLLGLERVLGRLSFFMSARLDPLFFERGIGALFESETAGLGAKSYLHLGMLIHEIILAGPEAYRAVLADPASAAAHAPGLDIGRGMFFTAVFRMETYVFEAQKARLLHGVMESGRKQQFSLQDQAMSARLDAIAQRTWGAVEWAPFIREQFRGARFEQGHPERWPSFRFGPGRVLELVPPGAAADPSGASAAQPAE